MNLLHLYALRALLEEPHGLIEIEHRHTEEWDGALELVSMGYARSSRHATHGQTIEITDAGRAYAERSGVRAKRRAA